MSLKSDAKRYLENPRSFCNAPIEVQLVDSVSIQKAVGYDRIVDTVDFARMLIGSCDVRLCELRYNIAQWIKTP